MIRKRKKVGKGFKIFAGLLTVMSILLLGIIIYLNVLSNILLAIVIGIIILIDGISWFLLLKSNKKKIGLFLSGFLIILYGILFFYLYKTTDFLNSLDSDYRTYNYSILVLKNSNYDRLKDISKKNLGYYNEEDGVISKALNKVTDKIEINVDDYDNTHDLVISLLDEEIDAILLEDSYLEVIETDGATINDSVKKIYSFSIKMKTGNTSKDLNVTKSAFNIYVSGIDTYGEITSVSRSDVNMVVTINPMTQQILLTSIPRDYYVQLHGKNGYPDKLTHAGMYGTEMSVHTIEDLLGIEINYYMKVNFTSVLDIVDAIGGVNVYSDYSFTSMDNISYKEGYNQVNGEEALSFARERKAFVTGDRQRVKNQQALLEAIFEKCVSPTIITKYTKLLNSLGNSFVTNMKMNRMTSLVKMQLTNNYSWNIVSNSLNGTDASNYTFSVPNAKAYVMNPISESVNYASSLINDVMENKKLDKEVIEGEQKKIDGVVAVQGSSDTSSTSKTNSSSSTSRNEVNDSEFSNNNSVANKEGLKAKLIRSSMEINLGDEYIYNGVTATYNGVDVTKNNKLKVSFRVGSKSISTYQELILYISKLDAGKYNIEHIVSYDNEKSISLYQTLTIKKVVVKEEDVQENMGENIEESQENNKSDNESDNLTNNDSSILENDNVEDNNMENTNN